MQTIRNIHTSIKILHIPMIFVNCVINKLNLSFFITISILLKHLHKNIEFSVISLLLDFLPFSFYIKSEFDILIVMRG